MTEVSTAQLIRWAASATLADSYMSLVYHRKGITEWDTGGTPRSEEWQLAMHKARRTSEELTVLLQEAGVDSHEIAREMHRELFQEQEPV
jgi:hypothetical protein